jgi:GAF domain-containing protein
VACDSRSRSEIVVPLFDNSEDRVWGVLDVDSREPEAFSQVDARWLETITRLIAPLP